MVSICKHVQNHDGRLIVATFLHPKSKFFCHSNKISHFGHVTVFWYRTLVPYCMFYTALGANIFGAISVLWCGFYFNRMALCKNTAEEWFCKLSHFRLDTLQVPESMQEPQLVTRMHQRGHTSRNPIHSSCPK